MDVTPLVKSGQQIIQSYAGGVFRVSGEQYKGAIIVSPDSTVPWAFYGDIESLSVSDFKPLFDAAEQIDVVLLGCGKTMKYFPAELRMALKDKGLSVDVMDTGAACRTYNVLLAEGRRVAAALIPAD